MTTNNNLRPCLILTSRSIQPFRKAFFHCWVMKTNPKDKSQHAHALVEIEHGMVEVSHERVHFPDTTERLAQVAWPEWVGEEEAEA